MSDHPVHILVVDYDDRRRNTIQQLFSGRQIIFHEAKNRTEGLGRLWELAAEGITPRAVLSSWLLDEPKARDFFRLIGREIDHTCLSLLTNILKIDTANTTPNKTILVCYTSTFDQAAEAMGELAAEGIAERVALASYDTEFGYSQIIPLVFLDERTKAIQLINSETLRKTREHESESRESLLDDPFSSQSSEVSETHHPGTSGFRRAVRRLSR